MTDYNSYKRRLGVIEYTGEFIEDGGGELLFQNFIPLFLTFDPSENIYLAKGLSLQFREVAIGEQLPSYRGIITKNLKADEPTGFVYDFNFQEVNDVRS